ncbi:MAG: tetratricopeptide repeat protein [Planctomycetales bacterium]|nr:tetratricopeptide repeat protein [Planctomycetales bacterium]
MHSVILPLVSSRRSVGVCLLLLLAIPWAGHAQAGGGGHNVVVVVNQRSWASLTVANEYVQLRNIPARNVIHLTGVPTHEQISIGSFRETILKPVLEEIRRRQLAHVDVIAYSVDFPWAVDVREDFKNVSLPKVLTAVAAPNGLTFQYQQVLAVEHGEPATYLALNSNRYVRVPRGARTPSISLATAEQVNQGLALMKKQEWEQARKAFEQAVAASPLHPHLRYNLACCLARLGKPEAALAQLTIAVDNGWSRREWMQQDEDLTAVRDHREFRRLLERTPSELSCPPSIAFRHAQRWDGRGERAVDLPPWETAQSFAAERGSVGAQYYLSTMLGVASGRGNSVEEVLECLRRATAADGTAPGGTIYFPTNANVRSKTREPLYAAAVEALKQLGVDAESSPGTLPDKKDDVAGAMIGTATFDWQKSGSRMLPGAICEHLTSFGGVMRENAGQTPLTEFIRHGAAGSSGTVTEPYAIQAKFPLAFLHAHYARGCSLAEAFYQSVAGPYQLLIVGDPLCQPWARAPRFTLESVNSAPFAQGREVVVGDVAEVRVVANLNSPPFARLEAYVDGMPVGASDDARTVRADLRGLPGGSHLLRVVGIAGDDVAAQFAREFSIRRMPTVESASTDCRIRIDRSQCDWSDTVQVVLSSPGADKLILYHDFQRLAEVAGDRGTLDLAANRLGLGSNRLRCVAQGKQGDVCSEWVDVHVSLTEIAPLANDEAPGGVEPGVQLRWQHEGETEANVWQATHDANWLESAKMPRGAEFSGTNYLTVATADSGVYQLQVQANDQLAIAVNDRLVVEIPAAGDHGWRYVPLRLSAGTYAFHIRGVAAAKPRVAIRIGLRGAPSVDQRFGHVAN